MTETPVDEMSFEEAMKELDGVVQQLERGDVALEASIALYERGAALKKRCETLLKSAEEKVAAITTDADGNPTGLKPVDGLQAMFAETLEADAVAIAAQFETILSEFDDLPVTQAMRWATAGGKRLRGFLVLEGARLHDVRRSRAIWPATAIEAMHAYSLVHDDLPAMDDDDLRRGQPTVHVKWDEATAILAGDALQALAFELVSRPDVGSAEIRAELVLTLARAAGAHGMVLGQALDIAAETADAPLTLDEITALQAGKTGALFAWAAMAGPRMAGASPAPMRLYADALGLAFQIHDDILDLEGDVEKTGKRLQKDADAGKATFVSLLGLDAARKRARSLVEDACDALAPYGPRADLLRDTARFVIAREC